MVVRTHKSEVWGDGVDETWAAAKIESGLFIKKRFDWVGPSSRAHIYTAAAFYSIII